MTTPPTDADLVAAFLADRPGARDALLDAWLPAVLQWCGRLGGPDVDPEDAAQDVFLVVLERLPSLRDPSKLRPWLFGTTRRVLNHHRRRAWVRRWVPGAAWLDPVDGKPRPDDAADALATTRRVQEALDQLPEAQREVLVLCDLEERSSSEAAALLDVPEGTVKSRLRLGRARFREVCERMSLLPVPVDA